MGVNLEILGAREVTVFPLVVHTIDVGQRIGCSLRGLPHPNQCPLDDHGDETIQHALLSCVFFSQVWPLLFLCYALPEFSPQLDDMVSLLSGSNRVVVENQCYDPGKLEAGFELADHSG